MQLTGLLFASKLTRSSRRRPTLRDACLQHGACTYRAATLGSPWRYSALLLRGVSPIVLGIWGGPFKAPNKGKRSLGVAERGPFLSRENKIRKLEADLSQEKVGTIHAVNAAMAEARRQVNEQARTVERSKWYASSALKAQKEVKNEAQRGSWLLQSLRSSACSIIALSKCMRDLIVNTSMPRGRTSVCDRHPFLWAHIIEP